MIYNNQFLFLNEEYKVYDNGIYIGKAGQLNMLRGMFFFNSYNKSLQTLFDWNNNKVGNTSLPTIQGYVFNYDNDTWNDHFLFLNEDYEVYDNGINIGKAGQLNMLKGMFFFNSYNSSLQTLFDWNNNKDGNTPLPTIQNFLSSITQQSNLRYLPPLLYGNVRFSTLFVPYSSLVTGDLSYIETFTGGQGSSSTILESSLTTTWLNILDDVNTNDSSTWADSSGITIVTLQNNIPVGAHYLEFYELDLSVNNTNNLGANGDKIFDISYSISYSDNPGSIKWINDCSMIVGLPTKHEHPDISLSKLPVAIEKFNSSNTFLPTTDISYYNMYALLGNPLLLNIKELYDNDLSNIVQQDDKVDWFSINDRYFTSRNIFIEISGTLSSSDLESSILESTSVNVNIYASNETNREDFKFDYNNQTLLFKKDVLYNFRLIDANITVTGEEIQLFDYQITLQSHDDDDNELITLTPISFDLTSSHKFDSKKISKILLDLTFRLSGQKYVFVFTYPINTHLIL